MYKGKKAYIQGLKEKFPQEEAAINKYMKLVQMVSRGAIHAVLLKIIPLPVAQFLNKCGLLTRFSPFLRASTQSLAEVLRQLPASPELQAVLSYIFPTYGGYWPWAVGGSWRWRCCPPGSLPFFLNLLG